MKSLTCILADRPERLLSSQLLRLENLVLSSFLPTAVEVFKAQWIQLSPVPRSCWEGAAQLEATQDYRDYVFYKPIKNKPATQDLLSSLQP